MWTSSASFANDTESSNPSLSAKESARSQPSGEKRSPESSSPQSEQRRYAASYLDGFAWYQRSFDSTKTRDTYAASRSSETGRPCSCAEPAFESRDPLTVALISNANARIGKP